MLEDRVRVTGGAAAWSSPTSRGGIVAVKEPVDEEWREVSGRANVHTVSAGAEEIGFEPAEIRLVKSIRVTFALG